MSTDPRYTPWPPPGMRRRPAPSSIVWPAVTLLLAVGLAVGGLLLYSGYRSWNAPKPNDPNALPRAVTPRGPQDDIPHALEQNNIRVYEENRASVVHITTLVTQSN